MRILAKLGVCLAIAATSTASTADIVFNGERIPSGVDGDVVSVTIDPVSGDLVVNVSGWSVLQDGAEPPPSPEPPPPVVTAPEPPAGATFWVGLNASTNAIEQWQTVTFAWNAVGAERCVTRRGNADWRAEVLDPANPTDIEIVMTEAGTDIEFRVFCFDAAGAQVADVQVITVTAAPEPPPPPVTETVSCDGKNDVQFGNVEEWAEFFNSGGYPDVNQVYQDRFISRNAYSAIGFDTDATPVDGAFIATALASGAGPRHLSISKCPGDFNDETTTACSKILFEGDTLQFSSDPLSGVCVLEPAQRYYINTTYVDVTNRDPSKTTTCENTSCYTRLRISVR